MVVQNGVRQRRKALNLTQAELASRSRVSAAGISEIENMLVTPHIDTVLLIARALDCTVDGLFWLRD